MLLYEMIDSLDRHKIKYAIVGGYAMALHGIIRATMDVDIAISMSKKDLALIETAFKDIGLTSKLPVSGLDVFNFKEDYIQNRNMVAWSFVDYKNPSRIIDIIITHSLKDFKTKKISIAGKKINVVSLKDLIKMKRLSGRPQDLIDIDNMERHIREK